METVLFPSLLDTQAFEDCILTWLNNFLNSGGSWHVPPEHMLDYSVQSKEKFLGRQICFDLKDVRYIGLHEALLLNVLAEFCHSLTGTKIETELPRNDGPRGFLATYRFFGHYFNWSNSASGGDRTDQPYFAKGRVLPLESISKDSDVRQTTLWLKSTRMLEVLTKALGDGKPINELADKILSEICGNIPEHSHPGYQGHGYCAVQCHYGNTLDWTGLRDVHGNIEIAIVDCGIGIKRSLIMKHPGLFTEKDRTADCIEHVLNQELPQTVEGRRRRGLLRVMESLNRFGGSLRCRSSDGIFTWSAERGCEKIDAVPWFVGTHYKLLLPLANVED